MEASVFDFVLRCPDSLKFHEISCNSFGRDGIDHWQLFFFYNPLLLKMPFCPHQFWVHVILLLFGYRHLEITGVYKAFIRFSENLH